ncbi:serine/threonine-protein kinase [Archangium violaceum]|uniref:serine/threonine-protein kinase n=1 Tax=Archangium violaceum TaxID=83451 RepID=UPI002B30F20F|nr:serine/threonine-protein kinase [Archangium gephyra]
MKCPRDGTPADHDTADEEVWEATVNKDVLVGHQIGEYVVSRRIGAGGMGIVYEGEHPVIGRKVAIKIIRPGASEGVRSRELVGEARAMSAIRHRGIIDIFGFGTLPGIGQYLVMEYLNGRPLDEVIHERAPMRASEVIRIILEVLGALSAAHAVGVIHRDLKPGNIFVALESNGTEYVKVLDFGLAKQGATPHGPTPQTRVSMIVGTPEYMAPEQACGQPVSPRTDLYAVGIILFEMLTGRLPFQGDSPMHVAIQQVQAQPPSPSSLVSGLPPELDALILRLLAKEPGQRPASAEAVERELKAIAKALAVDMTRLSGFSRAIQEPSPEPASAVRAQARQEAAGAAARRGGNRQPVEAPAPETAEVPRTSARPAAPARAQAARPKPAQEPAPRTQRLEEPPREVRRDESAPDTEELESPARSSRGTKLAVGVGMAVLLFAGVGLVMFPGGVTVSERPVTVKPVMEPPPAPKEDPQEMAVARPQPPPVEAPPSVEPPPPVEPPEPVSGTETSAKNEMQDTPPEESPAPDLDETPVPKKPQKDSARLKEPKTGTGKPRRIQGNGSLKLVANCWADVFVDGTSFGKAPRPPIELSAGKHTLELRNNPGVIEQRKEIFISPSVTLSHTISCSTAGS